MRQCRKSVRPVYSELFTPRRINRFLDSETKEFIKKNPRIFGYGLWKPIVIKQFLELNSNIEFVVYLDAGCELRIDSASLGTWNYYVSTLKDFDCLTFDTGHPEKNWTKIELIDFLNPTLAQIESNQLASGVFLMRRKFALSFCEEWSSVMQEQNYYFVTDELDRKIQGESFREHRHDQSVFSLLIKGKEKILTLAGSDHIFFPGEWESRQTYPIWTIRNASLMPALNRGMIAKTVRLLETLLHVFFKTYIKLLKAK